MEDIITAKQARAFVAEAVYDNSNELSEIQYAIITNSKKGQSDVIFDKTFSKKTVQALIQAGYKVEDNDVRTIIDWSLS
jgi:hypothetical protein